MSKYELPKKFDDNVILIKEEKLYLKSTDPLSLFKT